MGSFHGRANNILRRWLTTTTNSVCVCVCSWISPTVRFSENIRFIIAYTWVDFILISDYTEMNDHKAFILRSYALNKTCNLRSYPPSYHNQGCITNACWCACRQRITRLMSDVAAHNKNTTGHYFIHTLVEYQKNFIK